MVEIRWNNIGDRISFDFWPVFEILKASSLPTSEYHIALFLLSIYKDGLFDGDFSQRYDAKKVLLKEVRNSEKYREISDVYLPIIDSLREHQLRKLLQHISKLNRETIEANFPAIFDNLLYRLSDVLGKKESGILQPIELTNLVQNITELNDNESIYNPFAGLASFGVFLSRGHKYFGQEYNTTTWAIGKLRLMAYGQLSQTEYTRDDSINNWPDNEKFDLIVTNPPFGLKLKQLYGFQYSHFRTLDRFLIERGINSLTDYGRLIIIQPQSFLFKSGNEQQIREQLVDSDILDMVISMPGGLLKNTGIPFCIVVINKAKSIPGYVRFVDARKFITTKDSREKRIDYQSLSEIIKANVDNTDLRVVNNNLIRDNRYNLNVPRYFAKEYGGTSISDLCELFTGKRVEEEIGKLVRIRNLKNDKVDNKLDVNHLEAISLPRTARKIEESCLLVASRWKTLKPTFFKYEGEPIFVPADIFTLRIDEKHINAYYLINELLSDYVSEQLDAIRLDGVIPTIRKDDFLSVKITILPLEEQNAKVKGLQELSDKLRLLIDENIKVEKTKSTEAFNEFASLKHSTGTPRQNILSNAKSLIRFFEQNQSNAFKEINSVYLEHYDIELIKVFKQIRNDINHISLILERGENGLILEDYTKDLIALKDINEFVRGLPENGLNFIIKRNYIPKTQLSENGIEINIVLLRVLFDNILKNAHKYGFKKKEASNEVVIDLQITDDFLEITIKNNGLPFPKNYTKEKFIEKFNTTDKEKGTGIGGYDINRIAKYFGDPDWILELNPTEIFPVVFKFSLAIKALK